MTDAAALVAFVTDRLAEAQEPAELADKYKSLRALRDGVPTASGVEELERLRKVWQGAPHAAGCGYGLYEFSDECECEMPATVLADVAAKRRIVELCVGIIRRYDGMTVDVHQESPYLDEDCLDVEGILEQLAQPYRRISS